MFFHAFLLFIIANNELFVHAAPPRPPRSTSTSSRRSFSSLFFSSSSSHRDNAQEEDVLDDPLEDGASSSIIAAAEQQQQQQQLANEESYNWTVDQDAMVLAHDAIRKELTDIKTVLENNCNDNDTESWQLDALQTWWKGHDAHVRLHCQNERDHLHPAMAERLNDNDSLLFPINQLKEDHDDILTCLEELTSTILGLSTTTESSSSDGSSFWNDDLFHQFCHYETTLVAHFQQEEEEGVASTRQAFSATEWAPIIKTFFDRGAKTEFGSFIYHYNGSSEGADGFRTGFMKQRRIPSFVWRIAFARKLRYYETTMVRHMDALLSGIPPGSS